MAAHADADHGLREAAADAVLSPGHFTALQVAFLLLLHAPGLTAFLAVVAIAPIGDFFLAATLGEFMLVGSLLYALALLLPFASVLWVIAIRLVLGGDLYRSNVRPGVYRKWSRVHLRIWCNERLVQSVLAPLRLTMRSAPVMAWALRRLGATVGDNLQCAADVEFSGPIDLLSVEDDVAIQSGAYISTTRWVGQDLQVGRVHLGSGCKVGTRAAVVGPATVGRDSWITPLTPVLADIGPAQMWEGAPARFAGRCTGLKRTADSCGRRSRAWPMESLNIAMQVALELGLTILPTAAITWWATGFTLVGPSGRGGDYFEVAPRLEIAWNLGLYAFVTTWVAVVAVSALACIFLRLTPASPGLYPTGGLRGALLLYRVRKLNQIQRLWTWTLTGQYLRALAGLRFPRIGASECDLMSNLVPELAGAGSRAFWAHGCFTNMLDHGARHLRLCPVDMPANFFASNNCVVESGQFPNNFLLGVSTPANDIRFRRQMRSRLGEPITVAGNPPVRFGSADFGPGAVAGELPGFRLFLGRILLNDFFSIGLLPVTEVLAFAVAYTVTLRTFGHPVLSALAALMLAEGLLVCASALVKKVLVGSTWGTDHSAPFWSWRHFSYFFAQDCFFAWCRRPMGILAGTLLVNPVLRLMGCRIGQRALVTGPLQAADWNALRVGDDCVVAGLLQLHSFEDMTLRVKRTEIRDRSCVNVGATVMGGAIVEPDSTLATLSLVLKEMHLPSAAYEGSPAAPVVAASRSMHATLASRGDDGQPRSPGEPVTPSTRPASASAAT